MEGHFRLVILDTPKIRPFSSNKLFKMAKNLRFFVLLQT